MKQKNKTKETPSQTRQTQATKIQENSKTKHNNIIFCEILCVVLLVFKKVAIEKFLTSLLQKFE
jgi:hypothetical protein